MNQECKHISMVIANQPTALAKFRDAKFQKEFSKGKLKCAHCKATQDCLWACLTPGCGSLGCGREQGQHAMNHYVERGVDHAVCLHLAEKRLWCYECDTDPSDQLSFEQRAYLFSAFQDPQELPDPHATPTTSVMVTQPLDGYTSTTTTMMTMDEHAMPAEEEHIEHYQLLCGLNNIGNTCFFNSAVQALTHCPQFARFFLFSCEQAFGGEATASTGQAVVAARLVNHWGELLRAMHTHQTRSTSPKALFAELQTLHRAFRGFGQQDAQECIRALLSPMHETLKTEINMRAVAEATKDPHMRDALHFWIETNRKNDQITAKERAAKMPPLPPLAPRKYYQSIVSDVFEGLLLSQVTCSTCHTVSDTVDSFFDLSLYIPTKKQRANSSQANKKNKGFFGSMFGRDEDPTLEDCLRAFCSTEELTGDNKYRCEQCGKKKDSTKRFSVLKLPEILCIHLKRFSFEFHGRKLNDRVTFPLNDLDVSEFCSATQGLTRIEPPTNTKYSLVSVINHHGSFGGGHYTAFVWDDKSGSWYDCNDSSVTRVRAEEVQNSQAFILMYRRQQADPEIATEGARARALCTKEVSPSDPSSVFLSNLWFEKTRLFSIPGPCVNSYPFSICQHGYLLCTASARPEMLYSRVCSEAAEYINSKFGIVGRLAAAGKCPTCLTPQELKTQEKQMLDVKRKREFDFVVQNDSVRDPDEPWFLVQTGWVNAWKNFLKGDTDSPPGPIPNNLLFEPDGRSFRAGMRKGAEYKGLNKRVWSFAVENYGGGPTLVAPSIDIYHPDLQIVDDFKALGIER